MVASAALLRGVVVGGSGGLSYPHNCQRFWGSEPTFSEQLLYWISS